MPAAIKDFVKAVEKVAPLGLACEWDNSGLLLRCADEVSRVLITLDVTEETVKEAVESGCDMILSHHPLIWSPLKSVESSEVTGALVIHLIKNGISLYSAHTSFDRAVGGIGDILASKLELRDIITIDGAGEGFMKTGSLMAPMTQEELSGYVKSKLNIESIRCSAANQIKIKKVAVLPGSGGDFVKAAKDADADALITGEVKHHNYLEAQFLGLCIIEAGHYATERFFAEGVFMSLQSVINELQLSVEIKCANFECAPYTYY